MNALSIGLFTYSTKPRGSVVHAAQLAEALAELGHEVTLYALDKDGEGFFRPLRVPFVPVSALPAQPGSEALVAQRIDELRAFLVSARPAHDVLHAEDCLVASGLLEARVDLPSALLCRTVHHVERFESPFLEACQQRSVREADLLLSASEITRAEVLARYGRSSARVAGGVDTMRFALTVDGQALRARYAIPPDVPLLLSIGGVEPRKNALNMLEAFLRARRVLPRLHWFIVGGASIFEHAAYRHAFATRLSTLPREVARTIVQTGVLADADMPALYAASDLLLYASTQEGFGLCVLEAMAARRPVVVSRGAPFDEYLDAGCALFTDPRDPDAIAWSIVHGLRAEPARIASAFARARAFSWSEAARRHVALYRRALAGQTTEPAEERSEVHA